MILLAIDPGCTESAYVAWDGVSISRKGKAPNEEVLEIVQEFGSAWCRCAIEKVASFGMAVGAEIFETVYWSGRFAQAFGAARVDRLPRLEVKLHLCHDSRAKDANIRQALIDRFGGKDKAVGKKATPGPLYGVSADVWSALAVAVTYWDKNRVDAALRAAKDA